MNKKKSAIEEEVDMNMTPMIDVTFQLLIFFIITMKFRLLERKLSSRLPTDFGVQRDESPIDENFLEVRIRNAPRSAGSHDDKTARYDIEGRTIRGSDETESLEMLTREIKRFRDLQKDACGKINVGSGVPHATVVRVLDAFHQSGYQTVTYTGIPRMRSLVDARKWWATTRRALEDR